jgi:hypothetical protein
VIWNVFTTLWNPYTDFISELAATFMVMYGSENDLFNKSEREKKIRIVQVHFPGLFLDAYLQTMCAIKHATHCKCIRYNKDSFTKLKKINSVA